MQVKSVQIYMQCKIVLIFLSKIVIFFPVEFSFFTQKNRWIFKQKYKSSNHKTTAFTIQTISASYYYQSILFILIYLISHLKHFCMIRESTSFMTVWVHSDSQFRYVLFNHCFFFTYHLARFGTVRTDKNEMGMS